MDWQLMQRQIATAALGAGLLLGGAPAHAQSVLVPPARVSKDPVAPVLGCRVDPAVELLSVLAVLGGQRRPALDHAYRREVLARFAPFADHPAVRQAAAISERGYDDFVAQLGARLGPPPALAERLRLMRVGEGPRAVSPDTLHALVVAARAFARASDFATFYAEHAAFYADLCARVTADGSIAATVSRTADYFGARAAGYELVLMPLVPRLGVAAHREGPLGRARLTAFVGPAIVEQDQPRFRTGWALERVVLHEFTHQYVNAQLLPQRPALERSNALFAPMKEQLWRADHVSTWASAVAETVVRAAVADMRRETAGEAASRAELREHRALGFAFVDSVAGVLRATRAAAGGDSAWLRRANRAVIAMLDRNAARRDVRAVAEPAFDAGMTLGLLTAMPDSVAFIVPTGERDAALQDSLYANVRRMRDQTTPRATILTDREALGRDLRGWTLWAIGTPNGNAWLAAHADVVPARVDSTRIVAGAEHVGEGLVFASAVRNPVDPRRALLLTVGQRLHELAYGWWLVTADYAVMDGTKALERGVYAPGTRTFVPDSAPR